MAGVLIAGAALCMNSKGRNQTKQSTFTITTTELCRNIRGYRGPVPVSVTFSKGKITDIKLLPNHETPSYFQRVERSRLVKTDGQAGCHEEGRRGDWGYILLTGADKEYSGRGARGAKALRGV